MPLDLTIVTPSGPCYRGNVDSVVLPGSEGNFGVLPGHERFLSALRIGEVQIKTGAQTLYAAASDGFAEISGDHVTVLVDSCELAGDIDTARAELSSQRAEQGLAALDRDAEAAREAEFEAALARARNRIAVAQRR
ncbi:MAG TPA: ATP synthase F1 subunit epsilon [Myxococcota bacterium]|nr:ATP synthase F1 subunit epsilon [Myxococcota bacterium]